MYSYLYSNYKNNVLNIDRNNLDINVFISEFRNRNRVTEMTRHHQISRNPDPQEMFPQISLLLEELSLCGVISTYLKPLFLDTSDFFGNNDLCKGKAMSWRGY